MTSDEAKSLLTPMMVVRHVDVIAAKQYLMGLEVAQVETWPQAKAWGRIVSPDAPERLPLYLADPTPVLGDLARFMVAQMAIATAAWDLVRRGIAMQAGAIGSDTLSVQWTTAGPGQGGHSASFSWAPDGFVITYPERIRFPEWLEQRDELSDGDIYLLRLKPHSIHPGVETALRMSLECFRHEMYVPAVAMLGTASEGAWILFGNGLVTRFSGEPWADRLADTLTDPNASTKRKIGKICECYERPVCEAIRKAAGVPNAQLRQIEQWSDQVRESRNALHWNVEATVPNSYEKTAVLLMDAVTELRALLRLADVCQSLPTAQP